MAENRQFSPQDFLKRMDAGDLDGRLRSELKKLSDEELSELMVLMKRDDRGSGLLSLD